MADEVSRNDNNSRSTLVALSTTDEIRNVRVNDDGYLLTTPGDALQVNYDNTGTVLDSTTVQDAITELSEETALLAGRAGGQTLIGGTGASENLVLTSTSNGTKGNIQATNPVEFTADDLGAVGEYYVARNDGLFYNVPTSKLHSVTVNGSVVFTVSGTVTKIFGEAEIDGDLNHDGTNVGFYGVTPVARSTGWTITNDATDRSFDANADSTLELADVVATLIRDLAATGIIGAVA